MIFSEVQALNITIRLYKLHDYDLIYLYKNLRFPIKTAMYKALKAYVKKEPFKLKFPIDIPKEDQLVKIKNAQFHLKLDEIEDWEEIAYLKELKDYYRNSFLKNLLRYHLYAAPIYVYKKETDLVEELTRIEACEEYSDPVDLPLMKPRKKKKVMKLSQEQAQLMEDIKAFDHMKEEDKPEVKIIE